MRLIDADLLTEKTKSYFISPDVALKLIESQPTAFDLESVIEQLEEKRDYCYEKMKKQENNDIQEVEPLYFEQIHNQGMAYNNVLEILKSAANSTNGKNGG